MNAKWLRGLCLGVIVAGWFLVLAAAHACPGCADALVEPAQLPQRVSAAKGYNASIALFLLVPFGLVGVVWVSIARASRQHRATPKPSRT